MYDVVLISPHYHYDKGGRPLPNPEDAHFQDLSMVIPLGLIHLAQALHDKGLTVRVVHLPHEFHNLRRFGFDTDALDQPVETILKRYPARVCGIQSHFYLYCGGALHVSGIYKTLFPDSTVVVGGYMATACWKPFLEAAPGIDGVILGEGEKTLQTIIEKTRAPGRHFLKAIDGVASRDGKGAFTYNPPRPANLLNLDAMPVIRPDAKPFRNLFWPRRSFLNISRGLCPEKCAYCVANNRSINPRGFRTMQIDHIIEQLHVYQAYGIQSVFLGENHFLDMDFMTELMDRIMREDLSMTYELETHPAFFADSGLLRKMIAAGFHRFTMGCESGSDALLNRMGRRSNRRQMMDSVKKIAKAGGLVVSSWICNLPGETEADFRATHEMLQHVVDAGGFNYWIENLHVLPGSRLHQNPKQWKIDILLNHLADWVRWSLVSKTYVDPEDAARRPRDYLTHVNHDSTPGEMIRRLYTQRRLARDLVPAMKANLAGRAPHLPSELARTERQKLDWYEEKGWKLLLF
jgi:Radical SAM superfamily/B12 binding domain